MEDSEARVRVSGDVSGQIVVGSHNIVVSGERSVVTVVTPGQRPECLRRSELNLPPRRVRMAVGRKAELSAVSEGMAAGGPVQVHGPSGTGKSTLLRMAAHLMSDRHGSVVFIDAAGRDIGDVLQDVFEACYDAPGYRPSAIELRRLLSDIAMNLLLDDLECDSDGLDSVLDTVTAATVLYSAAEQSLWGEGRTLALAGLAHEDAEALLAQRLGRSLRVDEQPVAEALWRAAEGSPQHLLRAVTGERLHLPAELDDLLPRLLGGLPEAEQEVISLLRLAGAGGVSTGLLSELVQAADEVADVCERLAVIGLVIPTVRGYRIAPDVDCVPPSPLSEERSKLMVLCEQLRSWADGPDRSAVQVAGDGALIAAAIDAASHAGAAGSGARLARAAAPMVALSLQMGMWGRILERGKAAAERAREDGILAYLTHEEGIRALVTGKRLAAGAAFAAAAELWRRLGDSDHAGAAEHAGELCGPDSVPSPQPGAQDSTGSPEPSSGDPSSSADPGPDVTPDVSSSLPSAPPADPGLAVLGAKTGMSLTAKLVIGGGLAAVTAGGLVLGERAMAPDTVPVRVSVTTSVAEVTMPGTREDNCLIRNGSTNCTTIVTSRKGARGPVRVEPSQPLPDGITILYWGCDNGPEATSCTLQADKSKQICISTTSPADKAARNNCAKTTGSPTPSIPPSPSPSSRAPSISSVPDSYIGAWEGEFTEPGEQATSLRRIVLRKGTVGTEIADVMTLSRTSLCQAQGTLRSASTLLVIAPKTTSGTPTHLCAPAGDITLRRHGNAGLTWKSDGTTVTLHRANSPSRAVPAQYVGTWWAQDGNDPTSFVRMTIRQGSLGHARAEFAWDGDAHHCKGFSVLAYADDVLKFGPETVTASEPEGFCTQTPSRIMSRPQDDTMHVEWATPPDGTEPRSFTFSRTD